MIKINNFQVDLSDISAKTATLIIYMPDVALGRTLNSDE